MVDFKIRPETLIKSYLDFNNIERKYGYYNAAAGTASDPEGWLKYLERNSPNKSIFGFDASYLVRDYGVAPPFSLDLMQKWAPGGQFPLGIKLEFTKEDLQGVLDHLIAASPAGGFPLSSANGDPVLYSAEVAQWSLKAFNAVAAELGLKVPPELSAVLNSNNIDLAVEIYQQLPKTAQDIYNLTKTGLNNLSGVATSSMLASVDWSKGVQVASMTISSLKDRVITDEEAAQIGAASGALAGAALGSIIPGIGTAIGAAVGAIAGELIGSRMGQPTMPGGAEEALLARRQAQENLKTLRTMAAIAARNEWRTQCEKLYSAYYVALKQCIEAVAMEWTNLEYIVGWRFDIRWFDPNPGPAFLSTVDLYSGAYKVLSHETHLLCNKSFGCAYPYVAQTFYEKLPVIAGYDDGTRAAAALAARGFYYTPNKRQRMSNGATYSMCDYWANMEIVNPDGITKFSPKTDLSLLVAEVTRLNMAFNLVLLDLRRTATQVQTEKDLWAAKVSNIANGINLGAFGRYALLKSVSSGAATSTGPDALEHLKQSGTGVVATTQGPVVVKDPLVEKVEKIEEKQDMDKSMLLYLGATALGVGLYKFMESRK